ncbi:MAG: hypothetical protein U0793_14460 [Gemmataceae bacterium]
MGSFYGSIHVRSADRPAVLAATDAIARKQKARFLVGPALRGWIAVYPPDNGQDERLPAVFARRLPGELLHVLVHDDDIFAYRFYRDGKLIDQYNSRPDYFEPVSAGARRKLRGRPERIAHLLADVSRLPELEELLSPERAAQTVFASETLSRFADLLNLANAETAYEYLMQGDTDNIEQWDDFTHVPDLSGENARKQAVADEDAAQMRRWLSEGTLLVWETRAAKTLAGFVPYLCPDSGSGFYICWADAVASQPCPLEHYSPPWTKPQPVGIDPGASVYRLVRSLSGRFLGVAHACGDWHARLWDLAEKRLVLDIPHRAIVSWVGFSADEKRFITLGGQDSYVAALEGGERVPLALENAKLGAVLPDGTLAIVDDLHCLRVLDMESGAVRKTLVLGDEKEVEARRRMELAGLRRSFADFDAEAYEKTMREQMEKMRPMLEQTLRQMGKTGAELVAQLEQMQANLQENLERSRAEMARQRERAETGQVPARGSEIGFCMDVSREGLLCLGTSGGLRVYAPDALQTASDYMPAPVFRVDTPGPQSTPSGYIYGLAVDEQRHRVLFGGLAGRIEALDLGSGRHTVLRQLTGKSSINGMALARDGAALACSVTPDMFDQSRRRKPMELHIWDVGKLTAAR